MRLYVPFPAALRIFVAARLAGFSRAVYGEFRQMLQQTARIHLEHARCPPLTLNPARPRKSKKSSLAGPIVRP